VTFDPPLHIGSFNAPAHAGPGGADELGGFAVGPRPGGQRIYLTFVQEADHVPARLALVTSDDGGATWTAPRPIVPAIPPGWGAGASSVMVNASGVVGVQFFSLDDKAGFDLYFCASTDGGATFSTPVRISTATSVYPQNEPRWVGQDQVYGDVSADGNFQLVWTDARNHATTFAIYHRTARVSER